MGWCMLATLACDRYTALSTSGNISTMSCTCIVLEEPGPRLHLHGVATHSAAQHPAAHAILHCAILAATASCVARGPSAGRCTGKDNYCTLLLCSGKQLVSCAWKCGGCACTSRRLHTTRHHPLEGRHEGRCRRRKRRSDGGDKDGSKRPSLPLQRLDCPCSLHETR